MTFAIRMSSIGQINQAKEDLRRKQLYKHKNGIYWWGCKERFHKDGFKLRQDQSLHNAQDIGGFQVEAGSQ